MSEQFDSTDDRRTQGNDTRLNYRELTDAEKDMIGFIKRQQQQFIDYCRSLGSSRELSLAITKAQEASMWAVNHVTSPDREPIEGEHSD